MKVKMLTGLVGKELGQVKPGESVDLPKKVAEAYIEAGSAELVEKATRKRGRPRKTETEKATQPTGQAERATTVE
jgi:hypothetical protein